MSIVLSEKRSATGHIMTLCGAMAPHALGTTLIHEHLYMDTTGMLGAHGYKGNCDTAMTPANAAEARWNPGAFPENYRLTDIPLIVRELESLRSAGGATVVDATPRDLGRNPAALQAIALQSRLNIVMGCGYYLEACHPPDLRQRTVDEIADELVAEIEEGVEETGIRPGMIGEIGTGDPITAQEEKVLRAAARAQLRTGLALSVHVHPWGKQGERVLDIVMSEGVRAERVILNHTTTAIADEGYQHRLLERGANLAYDLFGFDHSLLGAGRYAPSDWDVAERIVTLVRQGYRSQLLISQDIGVRTRLLAYGGWGYAHLLLHIVPLLISQGLSQQDIDALLIENPARVLTIGAQTPFAAPGGR